MNLRQRLNAVSSNSSSIDEADQPPPIDHVHPPRQATLDDVVRELRSSRQHLRALEHKVERIRRSDTLRHPILVLLFTLFIVWAITILAAFILGPIVYRLYIFPLR